MTKQHYFKRVQELTPTKFWINNVTKEEARKAIEEGAVGCTQNPAYTWKMITHPDAKEHVTSLVKFYKEKGLCNHDVLIHVQRNLVEEIAEIFEPLYKETHHQMGYVSIQGDPFHEDVDTIVSYALFNREHKQNIMAKIPVTEDGLKAIAILAAQGVPINATEVMSVRQALDVCDVYEKATRMMDPLLKAPILYSHITGIFDEYLTKIVKENAIDIHPDYVWQAGMIAAKKTYSLCKQRNPEVGFIGGGARGLHHFTEMVGADANITINWKGTAEVLLEQNPMVIEQFQRPISQAAVDELCTKLPDFVKGYFVEAIQPKDYEEFGPVVLFRESFETAWRSSLAFIQDQGCKSK